MLKLRVITAIALLAVLLPVLFLGSHSVITAFCTMAFALACWESVRLFGYRLVVPITLVWSALFIWLAFSGNVAQWKLIWITGTTAWVMLFIPALKLGLPKRQSMANSLFSVLYLVSILACFLAIIVFQQRSPIYLLSVMMIVWVADSGAYFVGRRWGKRKLAPMISPGKTWEGVIGGWVCVLAFGLITVSVATSNNFFVALYQRWNWLGLCLVLTLLTAASVIGDLVESQLKRRAEMKDSSNLLPGHGGVLDRIDALIFVLPLAMLLNL